MLRGDWQAHVARIAVPAAVAMGAWTVLIAQPRKDLTGLLAGFAATAVLLGVGAGLPVPEALPTIAVGKVRRPRRWGALALAGPVLGAVLLAAALYLFAGDPRLHGRAWLLYLAAVAAATTPALALKPEKRSVPAIGRAEAVALALILAAGLAFRLNLIGSVPYGVWFDEAQNAIIATQILHDPTFRPVFVSGLSQMPALPFYYFAGFVALLGPGVLAVRLAATSAGIAAIVICWLLGRELFGRGTGLAAAALLAVSRWHVDFSRFGMTMVFLSVFLPLTLLLYVRGQRQRSPRYAVLAGLSLGFGLQFYYAMAAVPILLAVDLIRRMVGGRHAALRVLGLFGLTIAATVVAYAPVLQYGLRHPGEYGERFRTASILPPGALRKLPSFLLKLSPERDQVVEALERSTLEHLGMFHLRGDANGRHNLPGAPMLDPLSGLLFAVGLLWCLARIRETRSMMLLLWFAAMLVCGILSLGFEAPQGARSFGLTPLLALMGALPLVQVGRYIARGGRGATWRTGGVAAVAALLMLAGYSNWHTFFGVQRWDGTVWASFSTLETKIARVVRNEGVGADVYVPDEYLNTPTEQLILDAPLRATPFRSLTALPLRPDGRRALLFFAGRDAEDVLKVLRRAYPHCTVEPFGPPLPDGRQGEPVVWIARVPAADIAGLQGWTVQYRTSSGETREATTASLAWSWREVPVGAPFQALAQGALHIAREGIYCLVLRSDPPATLAFDGEPVLSGAGRREVAVDLARGNHRVTLEVNGSAKRGVTALTWIPPGQTAEEPVPATALFSPSLPTGGLLGSYFANVDWRPPTARQEIDPQVAVYFQELPLPRPFSIRWRGSVLTSVPGVYRFATESIDSSWVAVAGRDIVGRTVPGREAEGSVTLDVGWHPIEVRYQAVNDYSQVFLYWTPPGGQRELVPTSALRPGGPSILAATCGQTHVVPVRAQGSAP